MCFLSITVNLQISIYLMCFYPLQLLYLIGAPVIEFLDSGSWLLNPFDIDSEVFDS